MTCSAPLAKFHFWLMDGFYVSSAKISDTHAPHVVHKGTCEHLPAPLARLYLGHFNSAATGLTVARTVYPNATACMVCCPECNLLREPDPPPA